MTIYERRAYTTFRERLQREVITTAQGLLQCKPWETADLDKASALLAVAEALQSKNPECIRRLLPPTKEPNP